MVNYGICLEVLFWFKYIWWMLIMYRIRIKLFKFYMFMSLNLFVRKFGVLENMREKNKYEDIGNY